MKVLLTTFMLLMISSTLYSGDWKPGDELVDERDGQTYNTVKIGNQIWMAENLNIGTIIPSTKEGYEMSDNDIIEKYCWENEEGNCDGADGVMKRGGFYEWEEALQYWNGQPELPIQGICPQGWHIPSNAEWNELFNYLGENFGSKMLDGAESGFDALLTGYRCTMTGAFRISAMSSDVRTYFWTAEQTDSQNSPVLELGVGGLTSFAFRKSLGLCVRCIMDEQPSDVENLDQSYFEELYVSPNPIFGDAEINLKFGNRIQVIEEIYISDVLGNIVQTISNTEYSSANGEVNVELENLNSGIYFIVARTNNSIISKEITVLK